MATSILMVLTNPVEGREAEYNEWYSDIHIREIVDLPGFVSAQRFELAPAQMRGDGGPHRYLAIYEIEGDPGAALETLKAARPDLRMSDALDRSTIGAHVFTAMTDRVTEGFKAAG